MLWTMHADPRGAANFRPNSPVHTVTDLRDLADFLRLKTMNDLPSWHEVTPDDFLRPVIRDTVEAQKALLQARDAGQFRLRLVLREAKDLKRCAFRNPLWVHDYRYGRPYILAADEVVIETRDGRRHIVSPLAEQATDPLGYLDAQKAVEQRRVTPLGRANVHGPDNHLVPVLHPAPRPRRGRMCAQGRPVRGTSICPAFAR